jgi:hypothetical protein
MKISFFCKIRKEQGNKRRVVYVRGRFLSLCVLLRFGNTFRLTLHAHGLAIFGYRPSITVVR